MKEKLLNNNDLKTIDSTYKLKNNHFCNESEIISNYIIEKLISYVFSISFKKEVDKKINEVCYLDVKNVLDEINNLEFLVHDKDDLFKRHILLDKISKTPKKNKKIEDMLRLEDDEVKILNKSQIIKRYKLIKELDPNYPTENSIDFDLNQLLQIENQINYNDFINEKVIMNILTIDNLCEKKEKKDIISNNNDKISKRKNTFNNDKNDIKIKENKQIEKNDSNKINISIIKNSNSKLISLEKETESINYWDFIPQPKSSPIDRDASTKIKLEDSIIKINYLKESESENAISSTRNDNKNIRNLTEKEKTNIIKLTTVKNKDKKEVHSKKIFSFINFPSFDLEPETDNIKENEEIKQMRKQYECELEQKRLEKIKEAKRLREKEEKEKELSETRRMIGSHNVTVDIKGNLVFIRPLKIESLSKDFKKMRTHSKEVLKILDENYQKMKFDKIIKVEKNEDPKKPIDTEKMERKRNASITSSFYIKKKKMDETKTDKFNIPDKEDMKFASGSNFELMNLECGVNLIEKNRKKSGGKDFFKKYGRCSYEIFQNQINKTSTGFYTEQFDSDIINININDDNKSNDIENNMKSNIEENKKGLTSFTPLKILKKEKTEYDLGNSISSIDKSKYLNLKTNNLSNALSLLDLIDENKLIGNNLRNKNNILKDRNKSLKNLRKNYREINVFNKSLMGNKYWGESSESHSNLSFALRLPVKPEEKFLKREVSKNVLNHLPRKRLPPISSAIRLYSEQANKTQFGQFNIFRTKKNLKDLKQQNLSKDNIIEDRKKYHLSNTGSFFTKKEESFNQSKKKDEKE